MKILLFDADGVVLNSKGFAKQFEEDFPDISEKSIPFFRQKFTACLKGELDLKKALEEELPSWGWSKTVDDFLNYWFLAESSMDSELLQHIHRIREQGYKCYLATNQETHRMKYILDTMGLGALFDGVFSSCSLGVMKDNENFFNFVLDRLGGITPDEVLFWDDSKKNVEVARNTGIKAEVYTTYEDFNRQMLSATNL